MTKQAPEISALVLSIKIPPRALQCYFGGVDIWPKVRVAAGICARPFDVVERGASIALNKTQIA